MVMESTITITAVVEYNDTASSYSINYCGNTYSRRSKLVATFTIPAVAYCNHSDHS